MSLQKCRYFRPLGLLILLLPIGAMAQNQPPDEQGDFALEEVLVTATRVEQSLQDVPISVSAFSSEQLQARNIENTRDLQTSIPNISIAVNTGTASGGRIFIRGIGDDESRIGADSAVAAYVDDVYLARQTGALIDVLDLEAIEVLRGPQGTLYGRNATGGAIKYISKRPELETNQLDLYTTIGNYDRLDLKAVGNFAIGESTAVRASALRRTRDGVYIAWSDGDDIGAWDTTAARIALLHDFGNDWNLYLTADYVYDKSDPTPTSTPVGFDRDNNILTLDNPYGVNCALPAQALWTGCFEDYSSVVETVGFSMDIAGPLGDSSLVFRSLTGYRTLEDDLNSNFGNFNYQQQTDQSQFSQEFTLESGFSGPLNFIAGLYYFEEDANLDFLFALNQTMRIQTEAWAAFGEANWDITDKLRFIGGLRFTNEKKDFLGRNILFNDVLGWPGYISDNNRSFNNTSYRTVLQYSFTEDIMTYASYSTGFKSGGYSSDCFSPVPVCFNPVKAETVGTIEVGLRSEWMNNRLRLNLSYFDNTYHDLQLGGSTAKGFIRFNVPEVGTHGFELESVFQASEDWSFDGFVGYLEGNYQKLDTDSVQAIGGGVPNARCGGMIPDADCIINRYVLKNAPTWNFGLGANYAIDLSSGQTIKARLGVAYESESYNLSGLPEEIKRVATTIWDLRVALISSSDTWSVALWGKNLTDELYYPAGTTVGAAALGVPGLAYPAQPRTFGVDFRYTFD